MGFTLRPNLLCNSASLNDTRRVAAMASAPVSKPVGGTKIFSSRSATPWPKSIYSKLCRNCCSEGAQRAYQCDASKNAAHGKGVNLRRQRIESEGPVFKASSLDLTLDIASAISAFICSKGVVVVTRSVRVRVCEYIHSDEPAKFRCHWSPSNFHIQRTRSSQS